MDQARAIAHLGTECRPNNPDPIALAAEWAAANGALGLPITNAGHPDIQPLPSSGEQYIQQLKSNPWVVQELNNPLYGQADFVLVEIDKLLAFQFTVNLDRSNHHCAALTSTPSLDELLNTCLPAALPQEQFNVQQQPHSLIIKARSLNLRLQAFGMFNPQMAGVMFGPTLPLVQVSRFNDRCYLSNGFHRTYGLRQAGATHVPCMIRNALQPSAIGINDGGTLDLSLLESANPPAVEHFTQGRAWPVTLRATSRVIHLSWSEWVVADE